MFWRKANFWTITLAFQSSRTFGWELKSRLQFRSSFSTYSTLPLPRLWAHEYSFENMHQALNTSTTIGNLSKPLISLFSSWVFERIAFIYAKCVTNLITNYSSDIASAPPAWVVHYDILCLREGRRGIVEKKCAKNKWGYEWMSEMIYK